MEKNIYPYNPEVRSFPFYLAGIGGSRYQGRINRPDGYHWNQILYCAEGSGNLEYEETAVKIKEGDLFFLPKDQPHLYYPDDTRWDVRWAAFDGSVCSQVLARFGMTGPVVVNQGTDNSMEKIFDRMVLSQQNDILYCDYTCSGLVYDYIIEFHRLMDSDADSTRSRQLSMLLPVLRFMHDNFREDISMTDLSSMMGVTPQHFCRVFGKTMNMRPNEFLTRIRIDEAKRLMSDGGLSVSESAARSGFRDASYFSTVFRRYEGMPPAEYIKKKRS